MSTVGAIVAVVAIVVLLAAIAPLQRIVIELPPGPTRRGFMLSGGALGVTALAALVYIALLQRTLAGPVAIAVPLLLLLLSATVVVVAFWAHRSVLAVQFPSPLGEESITDPGMGIFTHRHMQRRLGEEFSRARRYGQPLSVLLIAVDAFDELVALHGSRQGDQVLHWLGQLLETTLRQEDIAGRLDERHVLILAPSTPTPGAAALAQRLRRKVSGFEFLDGAHTVDHLPLRCTVSVGVATLDDRMYEPAGLLAAAESALTQATDAGVDRVVVHRADGYGLQV